MAPGTTPLTSPPLRRFGPGVAGFFSLVVFLALPLVPFFGAFLALLAPLPLAHLVATGRPAILGWGWVAVVLAGVALTTRSPWAAAVCLGYLLVAAWPAVAVEAWLRRAWSTGRWAAMVALAALGVAAGFLVAVAYPELPAQRLAAALAADAQQVQQLVRSMGNGGSTDDVVRLAIEWTAYLAPAAIALYVLAAAMWLRPRLAALGLSRGGEFFGEYRSEEWLPVGFVAGALGWVFAAGLVKWLAANLLVTVLGLYFVAGLAIIHFYLGRRLGANRWIRLAVVLLALQLPVALLVSALGLADTFFSLRRGGPVDGGQQE